MNKKGENRIALIAAVVLVALILLSFIGCKTKTMMVTENVYVHDTVTSIKTDTVREVKVQTIRDTTIQKEIHTYTLDNNGDTVKEIHHYHNSEKVIVVDSTDRYKATVDSLRQALHDFQSKDKVVTKTKYLIRWWEYVVLLAIVGITIFFVLKRGGKTFIDRI